MRGPRSGAFLLRRRSDTEGRVGLGEGDDRIRSTCPSPSRASSRRRRVQEASRAGAGRGATGRSAHADVAPLFSARRQPEYCPTMARAQGPCHACPAGQRANVRRVLSSSPRIGTAAHLRPAALCSARAPLPSSWPLLAGCLCSHPDPAIDCDAVRGRRSIGGWC